MPVIKDKTHRVIADRLDIVNSYVSLPCDADFLSWPMPLYFRRGTFDP